MTRIRDENDQIVPAEDFIRVAEAAGLIGRIDHMVMLRCVQVLRRLMVRNKDVGVFCNLAAATLGRSSATMRRSWAKISGFGIGWAPRL